MSFEPLYFGPPGAESFGCLHAGTRAGAMTGLVLCGSFGREELCAHRTFRHLAEQAAGSGFPTLRFDYPGTGDSAGSGFESHQTQAWIDSIGHAIETLKARTGVRRVQVFGMRIGVLLAGLAIQDRNDISGLIAMAPITSGKAYVRELRMAAQKLARSEDLPADQAMLESGGFAMTEATAAELAALRLHDYVLPAGCRLLIADRDDRPPAGDQWLKSSPQHTAGVPARVVVRGYLEMQSPTYRNSVPRDTLREIVDWLAADHQDAARHATALAQTDRRPVSGAPNRQMSAQTGGSHRGQPWSAFQAQLRVTDGSGPALVERPCLVDPGLGLFGILTEPAGLAATVRTGKRRATLLLPPGADRGIGPGRLYPGLARALAREGRTVLRLDITGVGNSPARAGVGEHQVYHPEALLDVKLAIDYLRTVHGADHIDVVGHCSGAYNALKATLREPSADLSLVMINPLVFSWTPGMTIEDPMSSTNLAAAAQNYRQNVFSAQHWRGMLREPRKCLHVMNVVLHWPVSLLRAQVRDLLRFVGLWSKEDLGRDLLALSDAGVSLHFVFSTGDPGQQLLRMQAGRVVGRLTRRGALTLHQVQGADHDLSRWKDRVAVQSILRDLLLGSRPTAPGS